MSKIPGETGRSNLVEFVRSNGLITVFRDSKNTYKILMRYLFPLDCHLVLLLVLLSLLSLLQRSHHLSIICKIVSG